MIIFDISRLLKEKRDMSMTAFAEELGVEPQTVQYWNQGRATPRLPMILTICKLVGVSWAELGDYFLIRS